MTRPCACILAALALFGPTDLRAQRSGSVPVTATVMAAPTARVSARLVRAALKESANARVRRREGLVWIDVEPPRGGRRRVTINHLAN